jgi:hypothetical protein
MLTTLGILFYFLVLSFLLYRMERKKERPLSAVELGVAFGFKALMACLYGYIFLTYYGGDDTWVFHRQGLLEYYKMLNDTGQFFKDLLPISAIEGSNSWGQAISSYNMDLEYWTFYKILAVCNVFSRGDYYINAVLFSFITFWGHYWLFSLLSREMPSKRAQLMLLIFYFPPVVFWLSGIRTDGLIFFFLTLSLTHFYNWIKQRKRSSLIYFLLAMSGVLIYRNVLVMLLAPALIAWFVVARYHTRPVLTYITSFGISAILFFATILISPTKNLPAVVASRQHEYLALEGNTRYRLDSLDASPGSYLKVLHQSANNSFLRPYIWEASGILQLVTAVGILFFWLLVILAIIRNEKPWKLFFQNPLNLFLVFFPVVLYLFIGYTVPFPGAIVRYKCIPELMLLCVLVLNIRIYGKKKYED